MSDYKAYCCLYALVIGGVLAAGVILVVTEHYWWAWIPWLTVFLLRFNPPQSISGETGK